MLTHLHIRNFAIAPELELSVELGFTAITGETGAGKSILVDALGLLLGDRSDVSWVRAGAERADLSAQFELPDASPAQQWLADAELDDEGRCLLRRSIADTGRSRAWINGTPVTIQQLAELGALLVEIHGQNEHLSLRKPRQQLELLDRSGDYDDRLSAVRAAHGEWRRQARAFEELSEGASLGADEIELLRYQVAELADEPLGADQIEQLESEHRRLSHSGDLMEALGAALDTLAGSEGALSDQLHRVKRELGPLAELDRDIAEAQGMLEEAAINASEAAANLQRALDRVELNPERLEELRARLDRLADLARKHRVSLDGLADVRDRLGARLERAGHFADHRKDLEKKIEQALAHYRAVAADLSRARSEHAAALGRQVTELMADLGMAGGVFRIDLARRSDEAPSPLGDDRVIMQVSANPGFEPGPLAKVASGGELSRISLALKVAAARGESRTQVFDEVDSGIGGDTANVVGRLLGRLARNGQALCVTHLAQVAACADQQVRVDKASADGSVSVDTERLDADGRVAEIARMLSGRASAQSLAHARELLEASGQ